MGFRRRISWIAFGVVLAIGGPLTAGAQSPPGRLLNPTHRTERQRPEGPYSSHWNVGHRHAKGP